MPELLSRLDFQQIGREFVLSRAQKIDPEMVDREGSDVNLLVAGSSYMAQAITRQVADQMGAQFMDAGLSEDDLDRLIYDRYSGEIFRKGAAPAFVPLQLARVSDAGGAGTIDDNTKLVSLAGSEYVTIDPCSFSATQLDGVTVAARAVQAGIAYQVGRNQIRRFDNPSLLFDPSILVNNVDVSAGAADRETNDDLILRARAFFPNARRGTLGAIENGAIAVNGVSSAHAVEVLTSGNTPARVVLLYIADAAGTSNSVLANIVRGKLLEYRAGGITVLVSDSIPQLVSVRLSLTFLANVDTVTIAGNVRLAIVNFINSLGVNQPLYRSDLGAILTRFREVGLVPTNGSIVAPSGDIIPDAGRTLRARLDDVVII